MNENNARPPPINQRLMDAIAADDYDGAFTAILSGADVRHDNETPLRAAAREGRTALVQLLLESGADYRVHDHKPLRDAEESRHFETADVLRRAGSYNPFVAGDYERSTADRVVRQGSTEDESARTDDTRARVMRLFDIRKRPSPP